MTSTEATMTHVDPNSEHVQQQARKLAEALIESLGIADTIGVLLVSTETVLTGILHLETPMVEGNVDTITRLLDSLKAAVLSHESCARRINKVTSKERVH